jgi:hypothetical protein
MSDETKEAQKARAERLHRQIDSIKKGGDDAAGRSGTPPTPRDYVEKKMRELDESKSGEGREEGEDGSACEKGER